jgi:serine/threonine protein kinase
MTATPAGRLHGVELADGWKVVDRLEPKPGATGGNFSTPYVVERGSDRAFLKAIDIYKALRQDPKNVLQVLNRVSSEFMYERDLLEACAGRNMDRVVRAITSGEYLVDPADPTSIVFYLIFHLADGDIRAAHDASEHLDLGRIFRSLHDVAVAIQQLHAANIAHQDVKPSNVLTFPETNRVVAKVADLGRASVPAASMRHDQLAFAGDPAHAPPEGLYGAGPPSWEGRRACDLYLLGSLGLYLFTGVGTTAAWLDRIEPHMRPGWIGGTFAGSFPDALPYIRHAMQHVWNDFPHFGDSDLRSRVLRMLRELCDPDPTLRGHPRDRGGDRYSVARYVTSFDLEAQRSLFRVAKKAA